MMDDSSRGCFLNEAMFPNVQCLEASPSMNDILALHPSELELIEGAVPKRRAEFSTGRRLARQLIGHLADDGPILQGELGQPLWPSGIVGSISHCSDLVCVAMANSAEIACIGIDVEKLEPLPDEVVKVVLPGPGESQEANADGLNGLSHFCAKEAAYKALSSEIGYILEFDALRIVPVGISAFTVHILQHLPRRPAGTQISGQWCRTGRHIGAVVAHC